MYICGLIIQNDALWLEWRPHTKFNSLCTIYKVCTWIEVNRRPLLKIKYCVFMKLSSLINRAMTKALCKFMSLQDNLKLVVNLCIYIRT